MSQSTLNLNNITERSYRVNADNKLKCVICNTIPHKYFILGQENLECLNCHSQDLEKFDDMVFQQQNQRYHNSIMSPKSWCATCATCCQDAGEDPTLIRNRYPEVATLTPKITVELLTTVTNGKVTVAGYQHVACDLCHTRSLTIYYHSDPNCDICFRCASHILQCLDKGLLDSLVNVNDNNNNTDTN